MSEPKPCDRCATPIVRGGIVIETPWFVKDKGGSSNTVSIELCERCSQDLQAWMRREQ